MRILKLKFLAPYKQFIEGDKIEFTDPDGTNGGIMYSFLTGKNGSGKTTVMSVIAQIFHRIERYHRRIDFSVELTYSLRQGGKDYNVTIRTEIESIYISVSDVFENLLILDSKRIEKRTKRYPFVRIPRNSTTYEKIEIFLPKKVIASVFSIHGEWPMPREVKYVSSKIVEVNDISLVYGYNHYEISSINNGIINFLRLYFTDGKRLGILLKHLNLEFTNEVKRKGPDRVPKWTQLNEENYERIIHESEVKGIILIDLRFKKNGRRIWLDNMSSGEKMLMVRLLTILSSIENESVVFFEEPELHLDEIWKRQLISILNALFSIYTCHFIIATHSASLINTVKKENIVLLDKGKQIDIHFNTFLSDEEALLQNMYPDQLMFNSVEQEVLKQIANAKTIEEAEKVYQMIGDSVFKMLALNHLKSLNEKSTNE